MERYIFNKTPNSEGIHTAIQTWSKDVLPDGYAWFPAELMDKFYLAGKKIAGCVNATYDETGENVVDLVWNDEAYNTWVEKQPKWYELEIPRKISELSIASEKAIESGIDVQLREESEEGANDGVVEHFDLTSNDQANLSNMFNAIVLGAESYPYHSKDNACRVYTKEEIVKIYVAVMLYITSHQTRFNQLKQLCNSYKGKGDEFESEFRAIEYNMDLTGEYLEAYNTMMASAQGQITAVLSKLTSGLSLGS